MAADSKAKGSAGHGAAARHATAALLSAAITLGMTPAHAADPVRGARLYQERCGGCHSLDENGAGPRHRGVVGRRAARVPGYDYSEALATAGIVWTPAALDRWLADPNALVPGNRMVVQLAASAGDRADIIAFLAQSPRR
jgi:cytochrome c